MRWIHRLQIAIGVWICISPWVLGYAQFAPALWSSVVAGASVALIGFWGMFGRDSDVLRDKHQQEL
jgi:hypothetical protein